MAVSEPRGGKKRKRRRRVARRRPRAKLSGQRRCGLCGATTNLTKTECCGNWICDDELKYRLFSFARSSCHRNHRRYTLCGIHFEEGHPGHWKDCKRCRENFETELYLYYGTNKYNFEPLEETPAYEATHCSQCGRVIILGQGSYARTDIGFLCDRCMAKAFPELFG
jgi:hypothetical protein